MKHYQSADAVCPYYRHEMSSSIVCEGIPAGALSTQTNFVGGKEKAKHKKIYCNCGWWNECPVAMAIGGKYG